jgi:hypothetical protein
MGFLDRLFGSDEPQREAPRREARSDDEIALERYRYLLRTAPPETIEQVHAEAFAKLSPEQRDLLFAQLTENAPAGDAPKGADAASLASSATRSELRSPGTLERTMGPQNSGGMGFGSMFASSLLGSVAGFVIGSALVSTFMDFGNDGSTDASADASGDAGGDASGDASGDGGYGGDSGGDFGGGDFGGGDFGGDFGGF